MSLNKQKEMLIGMNLSTFSELGDSSTSNDSVKSQEGDTGKGKEEPVPTGGEKPTNLHDLLKSDPKMQSDFDKAVTKALQTHEANLADKQKKLEQERQSEEEFKKKLAEKMEKEDDESKRVKMLEEQLLESEKRRVNDIKAFENKSLTLNVFEQQNVPKDFINFLDFYSNSEMEIKEKVDFLIDFFKEHAEKTETRIKEEVEKIRVAMQAENPRFFGNSGSLKTDDFMLGLESSTKKKNFKKI